MKHKGDRKQLKKKLKEFLKMLRSLVKPRHACDISYEEFMKMESKKTRTPTHKRF